MGESYADAGGRHYADGVLLEKSGRSENADQLFGLAAECAIKSALVRVPGFLNEGKLSEHHRHHVDVLWNRIAVNAIQRQYPTLVLVLKMLNPYSDWSISQRYSATGQVSSEQLAVHKSFARRLLHAAGVLGQRGA